MITSDRRKRYEPTKTPVNIEVNLGYKTKDVRQLEVSVNNKLYCQYYMNATEGLRLVVPISEHYLSINIGPTPLQSD